MLWKEQMDEKKPPVCLHMTAGGFKILNSSSKLTVLQLIEKSLPSRIKKQERLPRAKALLRAAGLEEKGECTFGSLTDTEKQFVYILQCFVARIRVLICDDALRDMDVAAQSRVLRMMRRMKQDLNQSLLYISSDMQQLSLVSDGLGMLDDGKLLEMGPAEEVLFNPRHPKMQELISSSNVKDMMDSGLVQGSGSLQEFYNDLLKDSAMGAMWLPKIDKD